MAQPFTIYVMQSAHTDIGYTHPQEQLEAMYLEYYDRVLDLCRETADVAEEHRFKWTCETFWQVRHYLAHRPERDAEFLLYVRRGQIEITALYAHFTDLIDADAYRQSVALAVEYCKRHALPLRTAMHCDVNGWPWAVADILAEYAIPYFVSHLNLDMGTDPLGNRGSLNYEMLHNWARFLRPDTSFRIPQAFWWRGPQGGKVLHWLGDQYLLGNVLGLSGEKGFHTDKTRYFTETDRDSVDDLYAIAQREVQLYVERLREHNYALDALLISTGGFFVDNSPPTHAGISLLNAGTASILIFACGQLPSVSGSLICPNTRMRSILPIRLHGLTPGRTAWVLVLLVSLRCGVPSVVEPILVRW